MRRSAREIADLIRKKMEVCDIVLFGDDDSAKSFYLKYKEQFRFKVCITAKQKEQDFLDDENRLPVIEWCDYADGKNDYIVVAGGGDFARMETQLLSDGFHVFDEYVQLLIVDILLQNKKIAIMAGNCHLITMYMCLTEVSAFAKEYQVFPFEIHKMKNRWSSKYISFIKSLCNLYICSKHEEDDPKYFRKDELPKDCKIVVVPSAIIRLYWPQLNVNRKKSQNEFLVQDKPYRQHAPFEFGDVNINRMIKEGKDVEEITATISDENYYTSEQMEDHISVIERMMVYEDDGCDVCVSSYIKDNFQKRMLYRDMWHMQMELLWEKVKRLLECLGMDVAEVEYLRNSTDTKAYRKYVHHCTEIPVYPSVAKHLGLEWCTKYTLYEVTFYNGVKKMSFEEYIRAYYSLCSKAKQIQEEW